MEFEAFPSIPRLSRDCVITEKIDGTNGQILITDSLEVWAGSRSRWLSDKEDNHGFYKWVMAHREQLIYELGPGRHYGEWWGKGINTRYPTAPKTFSLFNAPRWMPAKVEGTLKLCDVTPILYEGLFSEAMIHTVLASLAKTGSKAWPDCKNPEGIVIYHKAGGYLFKKTIENDEKGKEQ